MDLTGYALIATMLIGAVTGITQMIKGSFDIDSKYVPWVSCIVGVLVGVAVKEFTVYSYYTMGLIGFVTGMSSSGFFSLTKVARKEVKK